MNNLIFWVIAVGGIGALVAALGKGSFTSMISKIQQVAGDSASVVATDAKANADIAETAIAAVKNALWAVPDKAKPYLALIDNATAQYALPPLLLARVLWQESRFRPDIISGQVTSSKGAMGIAQFLPATAADLGIDPLNPREAIPAAAKYLKGFFVKFADWEKAIAAYDWGQGNVERHWNGVENLPQETRDYVNGVLTDIGLM